MKKLIIAVLTVFCAGALYAQAPAVKKPAAPEKSEAKGEPAKPAPAAKPAAKPAARPADEPEEAMVMIDDRAETEPGEGGRFAAGAFNADQEEPGVPGGMPSSFGQCKGVITDAGRYIMVFESPDDGSISLVQLTMGKAKASWKLLDRIPRSAD